MDPFEFEDTVKKEENVLDAGVLESYLYTDISSQKLKPIDLSKEIDDIYIEIYNINSLVTKLDEIGFHSTILPSWEVQAMKLAELKQEYINHKKTLAKTMKQFQSDHENNNNNIILYSDSMKLIDLFKIEYDNLANSYKFSESAFLLSYKLLRDSPDPTITLNQTMNLCNRIVELLKSLNDHMNESYKIIQSNQTNQSTNPSSNYYEQQIQQIVKDNEITITNLQNQHSNEINELKLKLDNEYSNKIKEINNFYQSEKLDIQKQNDYMIALKENEISSLLSTINDINHQILESNERIKLYENDIHKRLELEDKVKSLMILNNQLVDDNHNITNKLDIISSACNHLNNSIDNITISSTNKINYTNSKINHLNSLLVKLLNIKTNIPNDITSFIHKISLYINIDNYSAITWNQLQDVLLTTLRTNNTTITELRKELLDVTSKHEEVINSYNTINNQLNDKVNTITILEHDLMINNDMIRQYRTIYPSINLETTNNNLSFSSIESIVTHKPDSKQLMIETIESQRDRYMKLSIDKENENITLTKQINTLIDKQNELVNENMLLYKRLQSVRSNNNEQSNSKSNDMYIDSNIESNTIDDNELEYKYMKLYNNSNTNSNNILSTIEKSVTKTIKSLLVDGLVRKILFLYLLLLHFFALSYVIQVLNPQLIQEIDSYAKVKYSIETFGMEEHPDN